MGIYRQFPYSNFHEMNLDWLLSEFDKIVEEWKAFNTEWDGIIDEFEALKEYVKNYFDSLDITAEVIAYIDELIDNGTFDEIISGLLFGYITPEMYGAIGNDINDDSTAIQNSINYAILHDKELHFKHGSTYKVSKNSSLNDLIAYPNNDEPCLLIINADNFTIKGNGAILHVHEHGQGILEIRRSKNCDISGLEFKGYGSFPKLDTNSGRAEKGTTGQGYYNALGTPYYEFGYMKNNSVDTSLWQGFGVDPSETWGTFGNGYIGNCGTGLLIYDNCNLINVNECIADGFNYAGFEVGTKTYSNIFSYNITFENCEAYDIYNSGFEIELGQYCNVIKCYSHEIGHPDAFDANNVYQYSVADPGYGVSITRYYNADSGYARSIHCKVDNCRILRCIRKGIDTHGGKDIIITNNSISYCYAFGIGLTSVAYYEAFTEQVQVMNNLIEYCGQKGCGLDVENSYDPNNNDMGNPIDTATGNIISGNIITNCTVINLTTYGIVTFVRASKLIFANNAIINVYPQLTTTNALIQISGSYNSIFINNTFKTGQRFDYVFRASSIQKNIIANNTSDTPLTKSYDISLTDRLDSRFSNNIFNTLSGAPLTNGVQGTRIYPNSNGSGQIWVFKNENIVFVALENVSCSVTATGYTDIATLPYKPTRIVYYDVVNLSGNNSRIKIGTDGAFGLLSTNGASVNLGAYVTMVYMTND